MSDPVSSMDVEDVLSSIRRLVSEEAKEAGQHHGAPEPECPVDIHEAAENAVNDALADIVAVGSIKGDDAAATDISGTPPFDAPREDASDEDDDDLSPESEQKMSFRHQAALEARRGEEEKLVLTAALRVNNQDSVEPETPTRPVPLRPERPRLHSVGGPQLGTPPSSDIPPPAEESRINPFDYAPDDTLFDRAKRAMEAVKSDQGTKTQSIASVWGAPRPSGADAARHEPLETPPRPSGTRADTADTVVAKPSAGRADTPEITASASPEITVDAPDDLAETASPIDRDTRPPEAEETEFGRNVIPPEEPTTINFAEEEESILDEETLRDLVSEMVREELQGELGDRITRNVRKLVRREIQRALASREFE